MSAPVRIAIAGALGRMGMALIQAVEAREGAVVQVVDAAQPPERKSKPKKALIAVIATLDAVLAAEIATLRREDPVAAALLTPYLAWTGFATALNASVSEPADSPAQR